MADMESFSTNSENLAQVEERELNAIEGVTPEEITEQQQACGFLNVLSASNTYIKVQAFAHGNFRWVFAVPSTDHPGSWRVTSIQPMSLQPNQTADAYARGHLSERVSLYCG